MAPAFLSIDFHYLAGLPVGHEILTRMKNSHDQRGGVFTQQAKDRVMIEMGDPWVFYQERVTPADDASRSTIKSMKARVLADN